MGAHQRFKTSHLCIDIIFSLDISSSSLFMESDFARLPCCHPLWKSTSSFALIKVVYTV